MKTRTGIAMVLAMALLIPLAVSAEEADMPCRGPLAALNLDKDQAEKLHSLQLEHRLEMIDMRAEQQKLRLEMKMKLADGETGRAELMQMVEKIGVVREKIATRRIEHLLDAREILNDEQWKTFLMHHRGDGERGGRGIHGYHGIRDDRGPGCRGDRPGAGRGGHGGGYKRI